MTDVPAAPEPRASFLLRLLSGPDNQTPAIGRVLGVTIGLVLVLVLLVAVPCIIAGVLLARKVEPKTWFDYLSALTPYVSAGALSIGGLIGGLIAGTHFTEPRLDRE